jgi:hypothetical protein
MSAGQTLREVRALLAHRQPVLGYLIVLATIEAALDLAVLASRHRFDSFSEFSRREFDGTILWRGFAALGHSSALVWLTVALGIFVTALASGWLRASYIVALGEGRYTWRPPTRTFVQLTLYSLLSGLLGLGAIGLADNDLVVVAIVLLLVTTPFTLYADYAIVRDDLSVVGGLEASVRVFRQRLGVSLLATFAFVFYFQLLLGAAFSSGFTDSTHVQPLYLVAWLLAGTLATFVTDAVLLTLYRTTPLSAGGSGGPPAGNRSSGASD